MKMKKRKAISRKERFEILDRDNFTCRYCGQSSPDVVLHVDHIHPVAKGGTNDHSNLVTACSACNSGKSDAELTENIPPQANDDIKAIDSKLNDIKSCLTGTLKTPFDALRMLCGLHEIIIGYGVESPEFEFLGESIENIREMRQKFYDAGAM